MTEQPPAPRHGRVAILTIAATSLLAIAAFAAAWQFGWLLADKPAASSPSTAALSAETQLECNSIRRAYETWHPYASQIEALLAPSSPRGLVRSDLAELTKDGNALFKAVSGHPDQPAKALAVAVATYNVDLGFVNVEHQLQGEISADSRQKAVQSAGAVQTAYKAFAQSTCGETN